VIYLGSLGYFLAQGLVLLNANANGASRVCSLLSLTSYPLCVHFASLTLATEYWGSGQHMSLNKAITIT
jgi:hypothetical protein